MNLKNIIIYEIKSYHQMDLMVIFHLMCVHFYFELKTVYNKAYNPTILIYLYLTKYLFIIYLF
jgi:hypothetical protein